MKTNHIIDGKFPDILVHCQFCQYAVIRSVYCIIFVCVCVSVYTEDSVTPVKESQVTPGRVHRRNERGETPLHVACIRGDTPLATSLIEQGAEVNATDHAGTSS